jgi:hypothetical protein
VNVLIISAIIVVFPMLSPAPLLGTYIVIHKCQMVTSNKFAYPLCYLLGLYISLADINTSKELLPPSKATILSPACKNSLSEVMTL